MFKMKKGMVMVLVVLIIFGVVTLYSYSKEKADFTNVSFTTSTGIIKFFDHSTGKIYIYSDSKGQVIRMWQVEELGESLKPIYGSRRY